MEEAGGSATRIFHSRSSFMPAFALDHSSCGTAAYAELIPETWFDTDAPQDK
jgi:hypothetical protein